MKVLNYGLNLKLFSNYKFYENTIFISGFLNRLKFSNSSLCLKKFASTISNKNQDHDHEKSDLQRRLDSIKYSLDDAGIDPTLSIPYMSEKEIQQFVIDQLVLHGVEKELVVFYKIEIVFRLL